MKPIIIKSVKIRNWKVTLQKRKEWFFVKQKNLVIYDSTAFKSYSDASQYFDLVLAWYADKD